MMSLRRSRNLLVGMLSVGTLLGGVCLAESAQALPLITISGSARGLYGAALTDVEPGFYGLGLGLRGGVTLPSSLYLGAMLDFFFGESETQFGIEASRSVTQVMGQVGYDLGLGPLSLRPSLGLGLSTLSSETAGLEVSDSEFVASPGAELVVGLGLLSVSAEARYNKVFADDADALVLGAGIGFSL